MQNLNDIFHSQRLLKTVTDDIGRLNKIHEIWFQLIETNVTDTQKNNFKPAVLEQCIPVSVRKQTLNLVCESSLVANHARFIQQELLREILAKGINDITKVHISIVSNMHSDTSFSETQAAKQATSIEAKLVSDRTVDLKTINTLEQFKSSCTSEKLRLSTERLIAQLRKSVN